MLPLHRHRPRHGAVAAGTGGCGWPRGLAWLHLQWGTRRQASVRRARRPGRGTWLVWGTRRRRAPLPHPCWTATLGPEHHQHHQHHWAQHPRQRQRRGDGQLEASPRCSQSGEWDPLVSARAHPHGPWTVIGTASGGVSETGQRKSTAAVSWRPRPRRKHAGWWRRPQTGSGGAEARAYPGQGATRRDLPRRLSVHWRTVGLQRGHQAPIRPHSHHPRQQGWAAQRRWLGRAAPGARWETGPGSAHVLCHLGARG